MLIAPFPTIMLLLGLIMTDRIECSHFLGGTITWRIESVSTNGSFVAIRLSQTYSYVYTSALCTSINIATNQLLAGSSGSLTCSPSCPSGFSVSAQVYCTDGSVASNIGVGKRSDVIWLPLNTSFSAMYVGGSWGFLSTGGSGWSISTYINVIRRSDTGLFNTPPVSNVVSPIIIPLKQTRSIVIPVSDADGDHLRCRWASSSGSVNECSSVCPPTSLPNGTILHSNCTLEIPAANATGVYAIALMVEDFINSTSLTRMSAIPVQFIVKFVIAPNCSIPPEMIHDGSSCITLKVNQTFSTNLYAINHCGPTVNITDFSSVSFSGMSQSDVKQINSSLFYKNLTWIPTINQLGYQIMCATALNSENLQSAQYCLTFFVTENGTNTCPGVITVTNATAVYTTSTTTSSSSIGADINWPLIGTVIALVALSMIISSICFFCFLKKKFSKKQRKTKNQSPLKNVEFYSSSKLTNYSPFLRSPIPSPMLSLHIDQSEIHPDDIAMNTQTVINEMDRVSNLDQHQEKIHSNKIKHLGNVGIHSQIETISKNIKDHHASPKTIHHAQIMPMPSFLTKETKPDALQQKNFDMNTDVTKSIRESHRQKSDHHYTEAEGNRADVSLNPEYLHRQTHSTKIIHVGVTQIHSEIEPKSKDVKDHHASSKTNNHSRIAPMTSTNEKTKETNFKQFSSGIPSVSKLMSIDKATVKSTPSGPRRSKTLIHLPGHVKTIQEEPKHNRHGLRRRSYSDVIVEHIPRLKV